MKPFPGRGYFILDGHTPVEVDDLMVWAEWLQKNGHARVGWDEVGPYVVSTVFLGLDHNVMRYFEPRQPHVPHIFETMVFKEQADGSREIMEQERWSTWEEADLGHQATVAMWRARVEMAKNLIGKH